MLTTSRVTPPTSHLPELVPLSEGQMQSLTTELAGAITSVFEGHDATLRRIEARMQERAEITDQIEELFLEMAKNAQRLAGEIAAISSQIEHLQELAKYTQEHVPESLDLQIQRDEQHRLRSALESKKAQLMIELDETTQVLNEGKARGMAKQALAELRVEAAKHGEEACRLSESAAKHKENAVQHHVKGEELRISAAQHRANAAQLRASAAAKMNPILCKYFFETFYGQKCPIATEAKEQFFSTYIANRELGAKKDPLTGRPVVLINDTTPFVVMSQMHRELVSCNLTRFTIVDVTALASYLASPDCPLEKIYVNNKISPEVEQLLTYAAAQREGKLEVKILTPSSSGAASSSSGQP
jgi:hypothetical protein